MEETENAERIKSKPIRKPTINIAVDIKGNISAAALE